MTEFLSGSYSRNASASGGDLSFHPKARHWFVDGNLGSNSRNHGEDEDHPFLTMAHALSLTRKHPILSGDVIHAWGNITEQISTPAGIFDVTVLGPTIRTRHADTHTGNNGYSSLTWKPPSSETATTPLLKVQQQGWTFVNILFDAPSDDTAIQLFANASSGSDERDGSHASFINCKFANGVNGIEDVDGAHHVLVRNCEFNALTSAIITLSTGVRVPSYWLIEDCQFVNNTNHVRISSNYGVIRGNAFIKHTTTSLKTTEVSSQGDYNSIYGNSLGGTYSIAGGYAGGSNDEWGGNFNSLTGGVTAGDPA